jgi:hypothetical protein
VLGRPPEDPGEIGAVEAGLVAPTLRPEALARQEQRKAQEHLKQELEKQAEQNDGFSRGEHGVMTN